MLQWFVATDPSATTGKSYATGSRGEVAVLLILRDPLEYLSRSSRVEEQTRGHGQSIVQRGDNMANVSAGSPRVVVVD